MPVLRSVYLPPSVSDGCGRHASWPSRWRDHPARAHLPGEGLELRFEHGDRARLIVASCLTVAALPFLLREGKEQRDERPPTVAAVAPGVEALASPTGDAPPTDTPAATTACRRAAHHRGRTQLPQRPDDRHRGPHHHRGGAHDQRSDDRDGPSLVPALAHRIRERTVRGVVPADRHRRQRDQPRQRARGDVRDRRPHGRARRSGHRPRHASLRAARRPRRRAHPRHPQPGSDDLARARRRSSWPATGWRRGDPSARTSWSIPTRCAASPGWPASVRAIGWWRSAPASAPSREALADTGADVTAVEVDHGLVGVLAEAVGRPRRTARRGGRPPPRLAAAARRRRRLGARRQPAVQRGHAPRRRPPRRCPAIERMLVMVQREVGERLAAAPGDDGLRRRVGQGGLLGHRPSRRPGAADGVPAPAEGRVGTGRHRAAVRSRRSGPRSTATGCSRCVRAGFGQRRKMLRRSLAALVEPADFEAAGIRPEARAEELDVADWGRLAAAVQAR